MNDEEEQEDDDDDDDDNKRWERKLKEKVKSKSEMTGQRNKSERSGSKTLQ